MRQDAQTSSEPAGEALPGEAAAGAAGVPEVAGEAAGEKALRRPGDAAAARRRWMDKFTPATVEGLLSELGEQRAAVEDVRGLLLADEQVAEGVSWEGLAWRWSLVYSRPGDVTRAWAYLVPDPSGPRLCVPLPVSAVEQIRARKLKKGTREAVGQGQLVAGVRWVTLGIGATSAGGVAAAGAEEIEEILRAKREAGGGGERVDGEQATGG